MARNERQARKRCTGTIVLYHERSVPFACHRVINKTISYTLLIDNYQFFPTTSSCCCGQGLVRIIPVFCQVFLVLQGQHAFEMECRASACLMFSKAWLWLLRPLAISDRISVQFGKSNSNDQQRLQLYTQKWSNRQAPGCSTPAKRHRELRCTRAPTSIYSESIR